jgi:uncharacterized protein (UPF0333 family)
LEFAILIGVVVLCFVALSSYVKFAAAGRIKSSADSLSQTLFNPAGGRSELLITRTTRDITNTDGSTTSDTVGTDETKRVDILP